MSDLISRQAAIDALDGKLEITGRTNAEAVKGYVRLVKDRLERLPPAQPEQQWIPCSERLPEKDGYYLTTTCYRQVYCDFWNEDHFDRTERVIAWMPLPEPYPAERKGQ